MFFSPVVNRLPFISGMRATPRRIVKSFFLAAIMGFLIVNMNMLIKSADDGSQYYENDPAFLGHISVESSRGNGVHPLEPRLHPRAESPAHQDKHADSADKPDQANETHVKDVHDNKTAPAVNKSATGAADAAAGSPGAVVHSLPAAINQTITVPLDSLSLVEHLQKGPYHPVSPANSSFIKDYITKINHEQQIHNLDKFDLSPSGDTVVIVIQVHNRPNYLRHLLDSLRQARHIEQTLLIFSHDFYDPEVIKVVKTVDFCPMMQIFYPFPNQIYTKEYPGEDPGDCGRNIKKDEAVKRGCVNALWPDKYGHYREAKYTQTKHHWFWKINHVFDHLEVTKQHKGPVLFIEEDHFVVEDFIFMLNKMFKFSEENCKECGIFTLGTYDKNPSYAGSTAQVEVTDWQSNKHNMGMALKRSVWQKIRTCNNAFCKFDDYNWDWSLQFTSFTCVPGRLKVLLSKSPRIFHIGECGLHMKGKNCDPQAKVKHLHTILEANKKSMFPDKINLGSKPRSVGRTPKPNGGWGDKRDVDLCMSFVNPLPHR